MKGSDVSAYFSTFIEFKMSQTAMTENVNKLITALLLLISLIYFIIYKQLWS